MKKNEEILLGGTFRPTELNCPTREGELIESLDKMCDIPNPRVGMRVYVENVGKEYIVKSLKNKTVSGVNIPNAEVDEFVETPIDKGELDGLFDAIVLNYQDIVALNDDINGIKKNAAQYDTLGVSVYKDAAEIYIRNINTDPRVVNIPAATETKAGVMTAADKVKLNAAGATKITWGASSNMNDYRSAGVYEIYGERTNTKDNLPILNSNPGHSIAGRLTVVDSSLQKADGSAPTEIHLTQFLMLDNRVGPSADMYMRTYTQDNGQPNHGGGIWGVWKKFQGVAETYISADDKSFNSVGGLLYTGLNDFVDNGVYTGVYTDDEYIKSNLSGSPKFLETFTLIVINNYAVAGKDSRLKRTISQLKYAVDAITNQATVKQRTKTDGGNWTTWQEIGGGNNEVDITDAVKAYGLPTLVAQGLAKEGVTYVINFLDRFELQGKLDPSDKIYSKLDETSGGIDSLYKLFLKIIGNRIVIDVYEVNNNDIVGYINYYKFITNKYFTGVKVSADMTTL